MTKYLILCALLSLAAVASAASNLENLIAEEHEKCATGDDSMACIKVRAMQFVDSVLTKESFTLANVEVHKNDYEAPAESTARGAADGDLFSAIENYIRGHDVTMDLPVADAKVTVSSRNLANDELSLNVKFAGDGVVEGKGKKGNIFKKGKKHRLRKLAMPIMVLILLKAITVIPMAIGILKIKAFNALALGFFSFIVSVGLAIFQLCKKIAAEHHSAHITAHTAWDGRAINLNTPALEQYQQIESAQSMAYKGYA